MSKPRIQDYEIVADYPIYTAAMAIIREYIDRGEHPPEVVYLNSQFGTFAVPVRNLKDGEI